MPGRLTGIARHLTDPAGKIYYATMEEGFYEVDVKSLAVKELYRDGNLTKNLASDLLPGLVIMALGLGAVFVAVTTAANAGVPHVMAGLAAALLNASQQLGGALGLAIFTAVATSRTNDLLASGTPAPEALTAGFQRALFLSSVFLVVAAVIGTRTPTDLAARSFSRDARRRSPNFDCWKTNATAMKISDQTRVESSVVVVGTPIWVLVPRVIAEV